MLAIAGTVLTARLGWRSEEALWEAVRGPSVEERVEALHVLACRVGTDFQDEDLVDMLAADEARVRELALLVGMSRHRAAWEPLLIVLAAGGLLRGPVSTKRGPSRVVLLGWALLGGLWFIGAP